MRLSEILFILFFIIMLIPIIPNTISLPVLVFSSICLILNFSKYSSTIKKDENDDKKIENTRIAILEDLSISKMASINCIYIILYELSTCSCGYHGFKIFPLHICSALETLFYFLVIKKYIKNNNEKNHMNKILIITWIIISLLLYFCLTIIFSNDMTELHSIR